MWANVAQAKDFHVTRDQKQYPGTTHKSTVCGATLGTGAWEDWGFAGDFSRLRSWAVSVQTISGQATMIVALVDLEPWDQ